MTLKRSLLAMALGFLLFTNAGCALFWVGAGGAAGAGTVAYVGGELKSNESVPMDRAWSASNSAMDSLGFRVTSSQKDAFEGELIARSARDKKIQVRLRKEADNVTQIRIRVGLFGDESLSRQILEEIRQHV